jgi:hypothetical protein
MTRNNIPDFDIVAWSEQTGQNPNPAVILGPGYVLPVDARTPLPNAIETEQKLKRYFIDKITVQLALLLYSSYDREEIHALLEELIPMCQTFYEKIEQMTADRLKDQNYKRDLHQRKMVLFSLLVNRFFIDNREVMIEVYRIRDFINLYLIEREKRCNRVPTHFRFID